jgi:hypothetical protein
MAKKPSQGRNKEDIRDLVRKAGLVSYVVELSDLYCDLVLANKLRFSEVAKAYMSCLTEYEMETKAVH